MLTRIVSSVKIYAEITPIAVYTHSSNSKNRLGFNRIMVNIVTHLKKVHRTGAITPKRNSVRKICATKSSARKVATSNQAITGTSIPPITTRRGSECRPGVESSKDAGRKHEKPSVYAKGALNLKCVEGPHEACLL
jgi:hypothetical protein